MACRDSVLQRAEEQRNRRTARVGASEFRKPVAGSYACSSMARTQPSTLRGELSDEFCTAAVQRELYMRRSHSKEKLRTIHFRSYGPPEQMQSITKMGSMKTHEN